MRTRHRGNSIDRRLVLAGGAALFGGISTAAAWAESMKVETILTAYQCTIMPVKT